MFHSSLDGNLKIRALHARRCLLPMLVVDLVLLVHAVISSVACASFRAQRVLKTGGTLMNESSRCTVPGTSAPTMRSHSRKATGMHQKLATRGLTCYYEMAIYGSTGSTSECLAACEKSRVVSAGHLQAYATHASTQGSSADVLGIAARALSRTERTERKRKKEALEARKLSTTGSSLHPPSSAILAGPPSPTPTAMSPARWPRATWQRKSGPTRWKHLRRFCHGF